MSVEELKSALRETLDRRGTLGVVRANLQAEIFTALDSQDDARPALSYENLLLNELIREYLEFNQLRHSLSVFMSESGQPAERLCRQHLSERLQLPPVQASADAPPGAGGLDMPLLYSLLEPALRTAAPTEPGAQARLSATGAAGRAHAAADVVTSGLAARRALDPPMPLCFTAGQ